MYTIILSAIHNMRRARFSKYTAGRQTQHTFMRCFFCFDIFSFSFYNFLLKRQFSFGKSRERGAVVSEKQEHYFTLETTKASFILNPGIGLGEGKGIYSRR